MLSRIIIRTAAVTSRLSKQSLQPFSIAHQSTSVQPHVSKEDLVIKSAYKPSGNLPTSQEYENVPVDVDGTPVVVTDIRDYGGHYAPYLPEFVEVLEDEKKDVDEKKEEPKSLEDELCVWFGHDMPTIYDDLKPERDVVNYPREKYRREDMDSVRMIVIPETFFKFFHDKTGVSGPYVFMGTFGTFLLSKEYLLLGDDAYNGFVLAIIVTFIAKKFGKQLNNTLTGVERKGDQGWLDWQNGMISFLEEFIKKQKDTQILSIDQGVLFSAKRENVSLQREAEYRRRLMAAYNEAKRKLDYHVAVEAAQKQFEQKHLVNWVIDTVNKSITPDLQNLVFQQSLNDLKSLSAKRRNAF